MDPSLKVNCYCFNEHCSCSIFHNGYQAITIPLQDVLVRPHYCESCHQELICKPVLHVQKQLNNLISTRITV